MNGYAHRVEAKLPSLHLTRDLGWLDQLHPREDVPEWFASGGNILLADPGLALPAIQSHPGIPYPENALIALGPDSHVSAIMVWGEGSIVALGGRVNLPGSQICCGGQSLVYCGEATIAAGSATLNARNGGLIFVEGDGLWSTGVKIFSDDMHAIRDAQTGERVNTFGGQVVVRDHVWLGMDVLLLAGTFVEQHSIVGARSVVTSVLPAHTVSVGVPARPVRHGVTWTRADEP